MLFCLLFSASSQAVDPSAAEHICSGVTDTSEQRQCLEKAAATPQARDVTSPSERQSVSSFIWPVGWWIAYYGFGLLIGSYIYRDAAKRSWVFLRIRPIWWGLLAVFDPAIGLIAYWAAHYSRLSQNYDQAVAPQDPASTQS
jgi:hypothetical protein